ncbi:MAG: hypothetical protein ABR898_09505 [Terracidiphilus sp.]
MASRETLWMFSRVWLSTFFVVFCSPNHAQQPAAGIAKPAQAEPGADANESPGNSGQKLSGLALVVKVASIAGDPLFHADGYSIRVQPGTVTAFSGSLKSLVDVVPGTWIHFEGVRDDTGVLVARKAEFFPPGSRKSLTAMGPRKAKHALDYQPVTRDSLLDADGHFVSPHTKVRLSDAGGPCGWHRVPADPPLQERVERIGMQIVPAFQKQLPLNSPSRIPFRFYAVADDKVRSAFACNVGLVLVPKNVVERLQNDNQLAAVLADAVAFNLQRQLVTISPLDLAAGGSAVVASIPALFPAGYIAGEAVEGIVDHEMEVRLQRELARMALQLVADAGFNPWQAPEAWRLLAPKDAPQDVQSLKYTHEGKYQLSILKLQYKRDNPEPSRLLPASAAVNPVQ